MDVYLHHQIRKENNMSTLREALKDEWMQDMEFFDLYEAFTYGQN